MAKVIEFVVDDFKFAAALTKVDRDKVYGFIELKVEDDSRKPCNLGSILDDGKTLVLNGSTALKTVDSKFNELEKKQLKVVYQNGEDAILVPSSFDAEVKLFETSFDDLFNLELSSVYQLDFEDSKILKATSEYLAGCKPLRFIFNYRADYEGADAILITNSEGVFALTGRIIDFPFLSNKLATTVESILVENEEDDEMDFGML
jgi:hypothetical protein